MMRTNSKHASVALTHHCPFERRALTLEVVILDGGGFPLDVPYVNDALAMESFYGQGVSLRISYPDGTLCPFVATALAGEFRSRLLVDAGLRAWLIASCADHQFGEEGPAS